MSNPDLLLIYPPVAKPAEPPAGAAQLKSALQAHDLQCTVIDANLNGLTFLLDRAEPGETPRVMSAFRNRCKNLRTLRSSVGLRNFDHYKRSVLEINRLLTHAGAAFGATVTLTDFKHKDFLPVRSDDLLRSAQQPQCNPFYNYFTTQLLPEIERHAPAVIGISLIYLSQAVTTFALIGLLRQTWPDIKIILGGGLVTSWMSRPNWSNPFTGLVDELMPGSAEHQLLTFLNKPKKDAVHFAPNYDDADWDNYFSPARILPYSASYGCYWRQCTFCPECAEGNNFAPAPYDTVVQDVNDLAVHHPKLIHFLDNALTPALLYRIIDHPLPAPWYGYVRFSTELEDAQYCRALRQSGCVLLQLGLESGNQKVLDAMQKGIVLSKVGRILKNLKMAGIDTYIYVLFGTPYEGADQARDTLRFVLEHADSIDYLNPAIFNMPVFSDEAAFHTTRTFYKGDLTLYHDFEHPSGWSRAQVRQFLQKEFRSQPFIKKIILANPPSFTSNHAPLFTDSFRRGLA